MKIWRFAALLTLCLFAGHAAAEPVAPSPADIARIEARGQQIAGHERAVIRATDLLMASKQDVGSVDTYLAVPSDGGWTVYFGKLSNEGFAAPFVYVCAAESCQASPSGIPNTAPPEVASLAKAISLVRSVAPPIPPGAPFSQFNVAVFREPDNTITAYLTPGNEDPRAILLGGDVKISISADGASVLSQTELHNTTLRIPLSLPDGKQPAGAYHTHVVSELPTETDVALMLLHPVLAPHFIAGPQWMTQVDSAGKITVMGPVNAAPPSRPEVSP